MWVRSLSSVWVQIMKMLSMKQYVAGLGHV